MTPRKRSSRKALLPPNLYENRGYYSFRNPITGEWFGIGRDKHSAVSQAIEANLHLAGELHKPRLLDKLQGTADRTVAEWLKAYDEILAKRVLADSTRAVYRSYSKKTLAMLGSDTKLRAVTALQVSEALDAIAKEHPQTAKTLRSWVKDCFAASCVKGWRDDNPVRDVKAAHVEVRRARLTFEVFQRIYDSSSGWFKNALALALISGQRRGDIARARFADVREGYLWVDQGKTGARLCIPLELKLDCFGFSLQDAIKQCRSTGVVSHYLVHQDRRIGGPVRPGHRLGQESLTTRFREALEALKLDFGDKTPPSFHEIRSLASRLYKKQGNVDKRELLGHKSEKSELIYEDGRGEWIKVSVRKS